MTSCAPTDRLLQSLRVHAPGVTDGMLDLELFNVMDEFFRRTSAWQVEVPITLTEGQVDYAIPVPVNATTVRVTAVKHNDLPVPASTSTAITQTSVGIMGADQVFGDGDALYEPDESDLDTGTNIFSWAIYRPNYITMSVPPDAGTRQYPLVIFGVLSLIKQCLECEDCGEWDIPEYMWDTYFQDWYDGTLARLYAMPAKPWSNPQHAIYHGKRFRNWMAYRKQEVPRGFTWGQPGPWRYPRGWT